MGVSLPLLILAFAAVATVLMIALAIAIPPEATVRPTHESVDDRRPVAQPGRLLIHTRVLFSRRTEQSITVDCVVIDVESAGGAAAPPGLPFTLQFDVPQSPWFADRVEELLAEWAVDDLPVTLDLHRDGGRVRTSLASDRSVVRLDLAGAAGLTIA